MIARAGAARMSRPELRAAARRLVAEGMRAILQPLANAEVARAIASNSDTHVDRCLNVDDPTQWQLADSLLLDDERRGAIGELVAGADRIVIVRPCAEQLDDDLDRVLALLEHVTETLRALRRAARDGRIDRGESQSIRQPAMIIARIALGLDQLGARAEREGVIGVRCSLVPSLTESR